MMDGVLGFAGVSDLRRLVLEKLIGDFVEVDGLKLDFSKEAFVVRDCRLKQQTINNLEFVKKLPVEVKESHISSIALQVQWRNLWNGATDAINLHIEGMTLHIVPIERNTQKNFMGDSLTDSLTAQIQQELQEELAEELRNREFQAFKIDHEDNEATGFFQSQIQSVLERIYDQIRIVVNDIAIFLRHTNQEFDPPESEFSLRIPKLEFLNEKQDKIDSSGNPATRLKMIHLPEFRINCRTNYLDSSTEETILSCSFQQSISIKLSKSMNELNRSKTTISAVVESIKLGLSPTHLKLGLNLIIALSELFNLEQQDQFSDFELRNEDGVHDQNVSLDEIDLQKSPQFPDVSNDYPIDFISSDSRDYLSSVTFNIKKIQLLLISREDCKIPQVWWNFHEDISIEIPASYHVIIQDVLLEMDEKLGEMTYLVELKELTLLEHLRLRNNIESKCIFAAVHVVDNSNVCNALSLRKTIGLRKRSYPSEGYQRVQDLKVGNISIKIDCGIFVRLSCILNAISASCKKATIAYRKKVGLQTLTTSLMVEDLKGPSAFLKKPKELSASNIICINSIITEIDLCFWDYNEMNERMFIVIEILCFSSRFLSQGCQIPLMAKKIQLSLEKEIVFTITASDMGLPTISLRPPLSSKGIFIDLDTRNILDHWDFEDKVYQPTFDTDSNLFDRLKTLIQSNYPCVYCMFPLVHISISKDTLGRFKFLGDYINNFSNFIRMYRDNIGQSGEKLGAGSMDQSSLFYSILSLESDDKPIIESLKQSVEKKVDLFQLLFQFEIQKARIVLYDSDRISELSLLVELRNLKTTLLQSDTFSSFNRKLVLFSLNDASVVQLTGRSSVILNRLLQENQWSELTGALLLYKTSSDIDLIQLVAKADESSILRSLDLHITVKGLTISVQFNPHLIEFLKAFVASFASSEGNYKSSHQNYNTTFRTGLDCIETVLDFNPPHIRERSIIEIEKLSCLFKSSSIEGPPVLQFYVINFCMFLISSSTKLTEESVQKLLHARNSHSPKIIFLKSSPDSVREFLLDSGFVEVIHLSYFQVEAIENFTVFESTGGDLNLSVCSDSTKSLRNVLDFFASFFVIEIDESKSVSRIMGPSSISLAKKATYAHFDEKSPENRHASSDEEWIRLLSPKRFDSEDYSSTMEEASKLTDFIIDENYLLSGSRRADSFGNQEALKFSLNDLTVKIHIYGGQDFVNEISLENNPSGLTNNEENLIRTFGSTRVNFDSENRRRKHLRSSKECVVVEMNGISVRIEQFKHVGNSNCRQRLRVFVKEYYVEDRLESSKYQKMVYRLTKVGNLSNMLSLNVMWLSAPEGGFVPPIVDQVMVNANLASLKLEIDQDTVEFLDNFLKESLGSFKDKGSEDSSSNSGELCPIIHIQRFEIGTFSIVLDYRPKRVDFDRLRNGDSGQLLHILSLDRLCLKFTRKVRTGISGFRELVDDLFSSWTREIKEHQVQLYASGIRPVRSLMNMGSGLMEVVRKPIEQFQRHGNVWEGIQNGSFIAARTIVLELLNLSSQAGQAAVGASENISRFLRVSRRS